ncbi:PEP-CTERM sorting domain-containing protein [Rugamonas sp. FT107W]|uniref:PEP-CTERM sorting domain-containing protein n=1 Tax=Duganella vulcania TaxID=2692166 RepID=A0A845HK22_9BURK|nr:FxDxF family PEP-CTERM protein [Duganella vulcania]MYN19121.1 PEP-CTERM sorting domain-containing protein [Duganella vulcania]
MKLKSIAAGALLAVASFAASAANQTVGVTAGPVYTFTGTGSLFSNHDVPGDTGYDVISFTGLAAGSYEVLLSYSGTNTRITAASLNGQAPDDLSTGKKSSSGFFDVTDNSPFTLKLWGTIVGAPASANYNGTLTITPVPEPETYGMLLGGLALMGVVARRKAKKAA